MEIHSSSKTQGFASIPFTVGIAEADSNLYVTPFGSFRLIGDSIVTLCGTEISRYDEESHAIVMELIKAAPPVIDRPAALPPKHRPLFPTPESYLSGSETCLS